MKLKPYHIIALWLSAMSMVLVSCHDEPEWNNDPYGNFDALWTIMDEHYAFFDYKEVDWQEVRTRYLAR